jgi:hypothetical protein
MDEFLDMYGLPKLNQDINNLNTSIMRNEIETLLKSAPTKKTTKPDHFTAEFYQTFKKRMNIKAPILIV